MRNGRLFYACRLEGEARHRGQEGGDRALRAGHGSESAAKALSVPRDTVRQWLYVYRSFGSEVLLSMDGKQARYTYEQKVAAASAVVDGGMSKRDAMEAFGVMSWRRSRDGARSTARAAPRRSTRPRTRRTGSRRRPRTREQEALEALPKARDRGGLPKKIACPGREGRTLTRAKVEAVGALREEGYGLGCLLECAGLARSSYYYALSHPKAPPGPSSGRPPPRYSRAPPTGAATGRSPCACAPSRACA